MFFWQLQNRDTVHPLYSTIVMSEAQYIPWLPVYVYERYRECKEFYKVEVEPNSILPRAYFVIDEL